MAKLKGELGQGAAAVAPLSGGGAGDPLFSPEKQKKWHANNNKAMWKWEGTRLIGSGDGSYVYGGSFQPPFVAQSQFTIRKGQRTGVFFESAGMQNAAYSNKLGLRGAEANEDQYFSYKHGVTYRCTLVVTRKQTTLYIDGKQICTGTGEKDRVEKMSISAGDGWSQGEVEVQDLLIIRATDKVANP